MSYSFSPALLSQWNLFPSTFLSAGKLTVTPSVDDTERLAVLSRRPVPAQFEPLTNFNVTSICGFCSVGLVVGVSVRLQNVAFFVGGWLTATTLDRPWTVPSI